MQMPLMAKVVFMAALMNEAPVAVKPHPWRKFINAAAQMPAE